MDPAFTYFYIKQRKDFGRQPRFCEVPVTLLDSIDPDRDDQKMYCLRNPVNHDAQTSTILSEHYINTRRVVLHDQGVNHAEGGWPKDINFNDEEATARHRRRIEREDLYVDAVLSTYPKFEHVIKQNNAIEMYNQYFKEMKSENPVERSFFRINNVFKDENKCPIAAIDWTYEDDSKLVAAYCNKKYPTFGPINNNLTCFVWDIEMPNKPQADFQPPSACWQLVCSPTYNKVIFGGLEDGRVCVFDLREKKDPIALSPMHLAHRNPVSALMFIYSRLNTEFFSGSSDGKCMWWDVRNISQPIDELIMSVRIPPDEKVSLANAEGVSALQFDKTFPTKFLCGTDTGLVINVNRKGKSHQDVMSTVFQAHNGPVRAVHRSPCSSKIFITCGDWTVHIWSDDIRSAPIVSGIAHQKQIFDVAWAPQRFSGYMSVCDDGKLRYWDLLRNHYKPVIVLPISKDPLLKLKPNDKGRLVAIGDRKGTLYLVSLSDNLVWSGDRDKQLMTQYFDRESRREHILETKIKEIRLKFKAEDERVDISSTELIDEDTLIKNAEDEYRRIVTEEIRRVGATTDRTDRRGGKMRKR